MTVITGIHSPTDFLILKCIVARLWICWTTWWHFVCFINAFREEQKCNDQGIQKEYLTQRKKDSGEKPDDSSFQIFGGLVYRRGRDFCLVALQGTNKD